MHWLRLQGMALNYPGRKIKQVIAGLIRMPGYKKER